MSRKKPWVDRGTTELDAPNAVGELKPCPFCGNSAYDHIHYCVHSKKQRHVVKCTKCNASMEYRDKQSAITAWNRRADNEQTETLEDIQAREERIGL